MQAAKLLGTVEVTVLDSSAGEYKKKCVPNHQMGVHT